MALDRFFEVGGCVNSHCIQRISSRGVVGLGGGGGVERGWGTSRWEKCICSRKMFAVRLGCIVLGRSEPN